MKNVLSIYLFVIIISSFNPIWSDSKTVNIQEQDNHSESSYSPHQLSIDFKAMPTSYTDFYILNLGYNYFLHPNIGLGPIISTSYEGRAGFDLLLGLKADFLLLKNRNLNIQIGYKQILTPPFYHSTKYSFSIWLDVSFNIYFENSRLYIKHGVGIEPDYHYFTLGSGIALGNDKNRINNKIKKVSDHSFVKGDKVNGLSVKLPLLFTSLNLFKDLSQFQALDFGFSVFHEAHYKDSLSYLFRLYYIPKIDYSWISDKLELSGNFLGLYAGHRWYRKNIFMGISIGVEYASYVCWKVASPTFSYEIGSKFSIQDSRITLTPRLQVIVPFKTSSHDIVFGDMIQGYVWTMGHAGLFLDIGWRS